jgi:hypothetical protein
VKLPDRAARNEEIFRGVNAKIEEGAIHHHVESRLPFHCECGRSRCVETIEMTPREWDEIASHRYRFVVRPGHELPEVERIVASGDRYIVVEKQGQAQTEIDRDHPRERHR